MSADLWAVTMVKDELDVLPYTLQHLESEGVAGIIVSDNMSTDGTLDWLQSANLGCELIVALDPEVGYYQSTKMTNLARKAFSLGAGWVLPFDADELWFSPTGRPLATVIADRDADVLTVPMHNYFPTSYDLTDEPNPFRRIIHRDPERNPLGKVLVRHRDDIIITQGNHGAYALGNPDNLRFGQADTEIAHFPWRSPEQFERKVRNGYAAYQATDLPYEAGAHWRGYGEILHREGPAALRDVYDTWFCDPDKNLEVRPAPYRSSR